MCRALSIATTEAVKVYKLNIRDHGNVCLMWCLSAATSWWLNHKNAKDICGVLKFASRCRSVKIKDD